MKSTELKVTIIAVLFMAATLSGACSFEMSGAETVKFEVKAPVHDVFVYMEDPKNLVDYYPCVSSASDLRGEGLGATGHIANETEEDNCVIYKMDGVAVDYVPDRRIVSVSTMDPGKRGVHEIGYMLLAPAPEGGTMVTMVFQYWLDSPLPLFQVREMFAKGLRERMEKAAENIKAHFEK